MAAAIDADARAQVALVSRQDAARAQLRSALGDFGADVVAEQDAGSLDVEALRGCGATVVIISLDSDNDAEFDALQPLLDDPAVSVVFDEASVSSQLSGWDLARWARHLAAKVLGLEDTDPPRPAGAEALGGGEDYIPVPGAPPTPEQLAGEPLMEEFTIEADELADAVPTDYMPMEEPSTNATNDADDGLGLDLGDVESALSAADALAEVAPTAVPDANPEDPDFELPEADFSALELDAAADAQELADSIADATEAASTPTLADLDFDGDDPVNFASYDGDSGEVDLAGDEDVARLAAQLDEQPDDAGSTLVEELSFADDRPAADDVAADEDATEAFEFAEDVANTPAPDAAVASSVEEKADRDFDFGSLSLTPMDDDEGSDGDNTPTFSESPAVSEAAKPEPAPVAEASGTSRAVFNLEPMDGDDSAGDDTAHAGPAVPAASQPAPAASDTVAETRPARGRAVFNLEPMGDEGDGGGEQAAPQAGPAAAPAADAGGISRVIVLGASIGGPDALRTFLGGIPRGFPALFVLAQHLESGFFGRLAEQLQKASALPVRVVDPAEKATNGQVLVVSAEQRVRVAGDGSIVLEAHDEAPRYQPSIDNVLRDMADAFGAAATAIIFSGMAGDAIEGSVYLTSKGGEVWAQDSESCVVSSMVDGARARGVVEFTGSPRELAARCVEKYGA